jgi:ParB family transcriptional regulator, chromosome partitioning protein
VTAEQVKGEGWKWVTVEPDKPYAELARHRRIHAEALPLPAEQAAELARLEQDRERRAAALDEAAEDTSDEAYDQLDEIDQRIDAIRELRQYDYSGEVKDQAGVVIGIGHDGTPSLTYGLVREKDLRHIPGGEEAQPTTAAESDAKRDLSAALVERLTTH